MAREEDLLFCKIAIAHGLVTQKQAQQVLALLGKRERDGARVPRIGAVFSKNDLMGAKEAQAVCDAVGKRLEKRSPGARAPSSRGRTPAGRNSTTGRAGPGARTSRASAVRTSSGRRAPRERPARGVDPRTLWVGIGFLLLFVGVIFFIAYLFVAPASRSGERVVDKEDALEGVGQTSAEVVRDALAQREGPADGQGHILDADQAQNVRTILDDIRRDIDDGPQRGLETLTRLEGHLADLNKAGYDVAEFVERGEELRRALDQIAASQLQAEASEDQKEPLAAETAAPAPTSESVTPEPGSGTSEADKTVPAEPKRKASRQAAARKDAQGEDGELSVDDFFK